VVLNLSLSVFSMFITRWSMQHLLVFSMKRARIVLWNRWSYQYLRDRISKNDRLVINGGTFTNERKKPLEPEPSPLWMSYDWKKFASGQVGKISEQNGATFITTSFFCIVAKNSSSINALEVQNNGKRPKNRWQHLLFWRFTSSSLLFRT